MDPLIEAAALYKPTQGAVAANFHIFSQLYSAFLDPFQHATTGVSAALAGQFAHWIPAAVTVAMLLWAGAMSLTHDMMLFDNLLKKILLPAAVCLTILTGHYQQMVIDPAVSFVNTTGTTIAGGVGSAALNGGDPFDAEWNKAYDAGVMAYNRIPDVPTPSVIMMYIILVIYWFVAAAAVGFAFALFLTSHMTMWLLLGIGPIFIFLGSVSFTRFLLKGFVSALASVMCAQIIVLAVLAIAIRVETTILDPLLTAPANASKFGVLSSLIIVGVLLVACTVLAFKAAGIAVGICGGIFDGVAPWAAAASSVGGAAKSAASGAVAAGSSAVSHAAAVMRPTAAAGRAI